VVLGEEGGRDDRELDDVTARKGKAEQQAAAELARLARERDLSLTGPDGLLKQLTRRCWRQRSTRR